MIHMQDMGDRIAERRRSIGWTQGQLAQKLGVTPQAVSKWDRGLPVRIFCFWMSLPTRFIFLLRRFWSVFLPAV